MLGFLVAMAVSIPPLGEIAYMREGKVWLVHADGSGNRKLADASYDRPLLWSPEGKKLIFWKENPTWQLHQVEIASGRVADLTQGRTADCRAASFSRDGKRIAFMSGEKGLCLMNADGSGLRVLSPKGHRDARPYWTYDGKILFQDIVGERFQLLVGDPASGEVRPLLDSATYAVSSDGRFLAYRPRNEAADLTIRDLKTGTERGLLRDGLRFSDLVWSRDGARILALAYAPSHQIVGFDIASGKLLPGTPVSDRGWVGIDLAPDGRRFCFSNGEREKEGIFVADFGGGKPKKIAVGVWPAWRPNGGNR